MYTRGNPIIYKDPTGHDGFQIGINGSAGCGGGVTVSGGFATAQNSVDGERTSGAYVSGGVGSVEGCTASIDLEFSYQRNAEKVEDFEGPSVDAGGSRRGITWWWCAGKYTDT